MKHIAHTTADLMERMAFDHPGAEIEYHDGKMFLTFRGITWTAIA